MKKLLYIFLFAMLIGLVFILETPEEPVKPEQITITREASILLGDATSTNGAQNATASTGACQDNSNWTIASATNLQTNDTNYAAITDNRFDNTDSSDQLNALDFGFTGISGTIDGMEVVIYGFSPSGNAATFLTVRLTTDSGPTVEGTNQAAGAISTSDDNVTDTFGSSSDDWGDVITAEEAETVGFGVVICLQSVADDATVNMDLVTMAITFTPDAAAAAEPVFQSIFNDDSSIF